VRAVALAGVTGRAGLIIDGDWVESKDQNPAGDVRLIQLADIGVGHFVDKSRRFMDGATADRLRCTDLRSGDILVARMPDPIGRACVFPGSDQRCVTVVDICIVRPCCDVADNRYLMHMINAPPFQQAIERHVKGSTRQRISRKNLETLAIPLPPLDEQRRIAAILDQADELRRKRRESLARLDRMADACFDEMFGDPVGNSMGWEADLTLGEVANIASGVTKGRKLKGEKTQTVPYLAVANVQDRHLRLDTVKTIEATEAEIARFALELNDLLLTEGGDPDKLGRGSLWRGEIDYCIHQNHVFRVRITSNRLHPLFLNWLIGGRRGKAYFLRSAKQTTGIASINMTQLRNFPMLMPPIEIQSAFAVRMTEIDRVKATVTASFASLDKLFASLQHRAFCGEL
jgi:type I restriction enzyme S subunit